MRPVAVVPEKVERQLVLEGGEAVGDQDQTPRALDFDGSDTAFDHRQAPMLRKRSEAMLNASASAPPPESLREELFAPVRDEMPGYLSRQSVRSFLIETPHPGGDGERRHQEDPGGLGERPAASGAKLENRQPLCRRIMGPSMCRKLLHAGILDSGLFAQQLGFRLEPITFGPPSELRVHALRSPALGMSQGGAGERDDLNNRRTDTTRPAFRQRKGMGQGKWRHEPSPKKAPG
jgi:hypothetical protein